MRSWVNSRLPSSSVLTSTITRCMLIPSSASSCVNFARYSCPLYLQVKPAAACGTLSRFSVHAVIFRCSIFSCLGDSGARTDAG